MRIATQSPEAAERSSAETESLLLVRELRKSYPGTGRSRPIQAVAGVSFDIGAGQTLGLVGESGCGKSTLARTVVQLQRPTGGSVRFAGRELTTLSKRELRLVRADLQIVFQDPHSCMDPRWTVERIVAEPLRIQHPDWDRDRLTGAVITQLDLVGLAADARHRFAHEFSGGQRQRIGIARALSVDPRLVVLDEPVSALDVSVQSGVINLLRSLQAESGVAYLFISHDLAVVRQVSHAIAVMYLGKIVEYGPSEEVYRNPRHPYTVALWSAVGGPVGQRRERIVLSGEIPSPADPPSGCRFRTRCHRATQLCSEVEPVLGAGAGGHHAFACHHPEGTDAPLATV